MYGGEDDAIKKAMNQSASNNNSGAIDTQEAYLEKDPHNNKVRMVLANIAFKNMMINYAIMQLNIIIDIEPDHIEARKALLTIYKGDKKTIKEAQAQFDYLLERFPEDADLLNSYGIFCRMQLLNNKKAEESYLKAIELDPDVSSYHMNYAILLVNDLKRYDEGRAQLEKAIELDPNNDRAKDALRKLMEKKYPKEVPKRKLFSFLRK